MKTAIYPGSFNPWHDGHRDVLNKALQIFDHVMVAVGSNTDKPATSLVTISNISNEYKSNNRVGVVPFNGLLVDFATDIGAVAIIKGIRNSTDLEYERAQQYWNEDLGITIPTVYFVTDRKLVHVSSSAVRAIAKFKK